jgi:hypothetical protein
MSSFQRYDLLGLTSLRSDVTGSVYPILSTVIHIPSASPSSAQAFRLIHSSVERMILSLSSCCRTPDNDSLKGSGSSPSRKVVHVIKSSMGSLRFFLPGQSVADFHVFASSESLSAMFCASRDAHVCRYKLAYDGSIQRRVWHQASYQGGGFAPFCPVTDEWRTWVMINKGMCFCVSGKSVDALMMGRKKIV